MDEKVMELLAKILENQHTLHEELKKDIKEIAAGQEQINVKLEKIVEGIQSHVEQNDLQHTEILRRMDEKTDLLSLAIRNIAGKKRRIG